MCRLYGFRATHDTEVGCELIESQNSLIRQSERDSRGLSNPHGWGLGIWNGSWVSRERDVDPASSDEEFRQDAGKISAQTVLAHIRRATVGEPRRVNTHPFACRNHMLAHNGHIPAFDRVRPKMLEAMTPEHRNAVSGDTDSEHFFHLLLTHFESDDELSMGDALRRTARQVYEWSHAEDPDEELALNILWTNQDALVGCRHNRSLWYTERRDIHLCEICGTFHTDESHRGEYHSVVVASEQITGDEVWTEVPEDHIFQLDGDYKLQTTPLGLP